MAVSGLDSIDRRSADIRLLSRLAATICATGRPFWYDGRQRDIARQIEKHLDAYLDRSHATMLAILPLMPPATKNASANNAESVPAIGSLVVEQFGNHHIPDAMVERSETIAVHSASALANAIEHESLFLLPLWKTLGKARWMVPPRTLPKTFFLLAALVAIAAALVLVPADFDLGATGKLQPTVRRDVFAHTDGVVIDVPVRHEQIVEQGQVLAQLNNTELDVQIADLMGRQRANRERMLSLQRLQLDGRRLRTWRSRTDCRVSYWNCVKSRKVSTGNSNCCGRRKNSSSCAARCEGRS